MHAKKPQCSFVGVEVAKYPMFSLLTSKLDKKSFQTEPQ